MRPDESEMGDVAGGAIPKEVGRQRLSEAGFHLAADC